MDPVQPIHNFHPGQPFQQPGQFNTMNTQGPSFQQRPTQFQQQNFMPHPQSMNATQQPPQPQQPPQQAQPPQTPKPISVKRRVEIKSVGVWSMAKFQGLVNTIVGVVMAAVYMILGTILEWIIPNVTGTTAGTENAVNAALGSGAGISLYLATLTSPSVTVFVMIILGSALIGFIAGAVLAIFYNILAVIVGGVEIELKAKY